MLEDNVACNAGDGNGGDDGKEDDGFAVEPMVSIAEAHLNDVFMANYGMRLKENASRGRLLQGHQPQLAKSIKLLLPYY